MSLPPRDRTTAVYDDLMLPGTVYRLLAPFRKEYALVTDGEDFYLLWLKRAWLYLLECRLSAEDDNRPVSQPLLMPVRLKLDREERESLRQWQPCLEQKGIQFTQDGHGVV
ncbi:TPA: hypothetical protein ACIVON_005473, partial [Salmonella enterica subsp. enterica serovar Poona]